MLFQNSLPKDSSEPWRERNKGRGDRGSGSMSEPTMAMQRVIWAPSVFARGRDWAPVTELQNLIIQQSGSSSDSKTESNTNGEKSRIWLKLLGKSESQRLGSGVK